jgi:putative sigma-54 modulation protein
VVELEIQGRNLEISGQVRNHVSQKLGQLGRHLPGLTRAAVELASEATRAQEDRVVAQITLDVSGYILRAEQRAPNARAAINSAAEVLTRRIERYKGQTYRSERARQAPPLRVQEAEGASQAANHEEVAQLADGGQVRIKRFDMTPMTMEEAAFQMELLGHHFFMFLNSDTGDHNVMYQRDDGNFGLIRPNG